jgi:hypothetical protein
MTWLAVGDPSLLPWLLASQRMFVHVLASQVWTAAMELLLASAAMMMFCYGPAI